MGAALRHGWNIWMITTLTWAVWGPAVIAVSDILETLTEIYEENEELFLQNPEFFIKRAMLSANRVLGGFKMGNEERYYGYAASVTCCLFCQDGIFLYGTYREYKIIYFKK